MQAQALDPSRPVSGAYLAGVAWVRGRRVVYTAGAQICTVLTLRSGTEVITAYVRNPSLLDLDVREGDLVYVEGSLWASVEHSPCFLVAARVYRILPHEILACIVPAARRAAGEVCVSVSQAGAARLLHLLAGELASPTASVGYGATEEELRALAVCLQSGLPPRLRTPLPARPRTPPCADPAAEA